MRQISFRDKLKYRFDNFMSKGAGALIIGLLLLSVVITVVSAVVVLVFKIGPEEQSVAWLLWGGVMRLMDAGTVAGDVGDWPYLFLMFAVTLGGIFIFSTLIGVLTTGLEDKLDQLRKGRSFVAEKNHTVVLGWSTQIFSVVSELVLANESLSSACITVMADKDKVEMDDELRDKVGDYKTTKIVCRSGDPIDLDDLDIVNLQAAKSIIVLPEDCDGADASMLKTVLALNSILGDMETPPHITAVVRNRSNMRAARIAGGDNAVFLPSAEIIARIMAQTSRQSGLSMVLTEIIEFSGSEIYFYSDERLHGMSYHRAITAFEESAVIGIRKSDGSIHLNPVMDMRVEENDQIVCLAEDDDTIKLTHPDSPEVNEADIRLSKGEPGKPERTLVLGWNRLGAPLITNLDGYVTKGSQMQIAAVNPPDQEDFGATLSNMELTCISANKSDRAFLDQLKVSSLDQVIILSRNDLPPNLADADTLATLLHMRDISEINKASFPIITEILDSRTQELARAARADDFIVSDRLLSLMLAQISEKPELSVVFDEIFSPEGVELYIKPASLFLVPDKPVSVNTVMEAGARRGETVVGYRLGEHLANADENYGVRLNPKKSESITLGAKDSIIVLADDEM